LFSDSPFPSSAEIASVFPAGGSLGGGTDLTVTGDFFEEPVQVTAAGKRRNVLNIWCLLVWSFSVQLSWP